MKKKTNKEMNSLIGERIKWARKSAGMTQAELSSRLGFKDRQILANIETGVRKVSADELMNLMASLGKSLDYFTDPYIIVEENIFSWRAEPTFDEIDYYETRTRNLVGAFRRFTDLLGKTITPIIPTIPLTAKSSYEQAISLAEAFVEHLQLGDIPAKRLQEVAEKKLGINILFVDVPSGLSGAACHLADLNMILISRMDSVCRRNFDMAHEIFHLLTWEKEKMRPDQVDVPGTVDIRKPRIETLADNFASALLMPEASLDRQWRKNTNLEIHTRINETAKHFEVSSQAAYYRLKNLGWLDGLGEIDGSLLKWNAQAKTPRLYSKLFVDMLFEVLKKGLVSSRKAAALLDKDIEDIDELFRDYGYESLHDI